MRKYLIAILSIILLFAACKKKQDAVFDQSPDQRLSAVITAFQNKLVSPEGWKVTVSPVTPGWYSFYMKFTNTNRVTMWSDISDSTAGVARESSYRLKALQSPTIIFDTYNYLHILMDPTPSINGAVTGAGLSSDIEYYFPTALNQALLGSKPDTITNMALKGRFNGADILFTKATAAEAASYAAGDLRKFRVNVNSYLNANKFLLYMDFGDGIKVMVIIDLNGRSVNFFWVKNGTAFSFASTFDIVLDGLVLQTPFTYNTTTISKIIFDGTKFSGAGSGTPASIQVGAIPAYPLNVLLGTAFTGVNLPAVTTFPGWSDDFKARRASSAAAMLAGPYRLTLGQMDFSPITTSTFNLTVDIFQGTNRFLAAFPYVYTKTQAGVYKFSAGIASGNASLIVANMAPLLGQRLNTDNFTLDYFSDPTEGVLAKFTSVQHPDFVFTGRMR